MAHRKEGIAACALLCLAMVAASSNYIDKEVPLGKKHLIISRESLKNTTLLYGLCDFGDSAKPHGSCEVILETFNFDGTSKKLSCEVPLKARIAGDIKPAHAGNNKAVLVALDDPQENSEKQQVHLMNVDLASCKTVYVKVAAPPTPTNWTSDGVSAIAYENTYDVIFYHLDGLGDSNWKGTFDLEGNVVKAIAPWTELEVTKNYLQLTNAKYQSADGGFILTSSGSGQLVTSLINDDGKKVLGKLDLPAPGENFNNLVFFDNNETVSVCVYIPKNPRVKCVAIGPQGAVKAEVIVDVAPYYFASVLDGHIVVHGKCIDLEKPEMQQSCEDRKIYVRRLNAEGQLVKELQLSTFPFDYDVEHFSAHVFKNEAGETCVSYINFFNSIEAHLDGYPNKLKVAAQCFADL